MLGSKHLDLLLSCLAHKGAGSHQCGLGWAIVVFILWCETVGNHRPSNSYSGLNKNWLNNLPSIWKCQSPQFFTTYWLWHVSLFISLVCFFFFLFVSLLFFFFFKKKDFSIKLDFFSWLFKIGKLFISSDSIYHLWFDFTHSFGFSIWFFNFWEKKKL